MRSPNQRITIKHVARGAEVSTQTVSRVLNDRPDVAPETRQRVLQVIDQLGYQPSELARSLIQRRSFTLGVVTAGLKFIGPSRTLNGITTKAEELGYSLLLKALPHFTANHVEPLIQSLLARQVDGILWAVPEIGDNRAWVEARQCDLPVPMVFLTMQPRPGVSMVSIDNYAGGALATRYLLEQGCRKIGHISGPLDWWEARQRKLAWQETLAQAGRPPLDSHWTEGNWSSSSGEAAFAQLFQSYAGMDAVFVANDQMALGALQAAHQRGLRVPQDLAVVGFDNIAESAYFWPGLTTINQNQDELGCLAVQELVKRIEAAQGGILDARPQSILLPPELVVRGSTGSDKKV